MNITRVTDKMLDLEYKYQRICSTEGNVIGIEFLIDMSRANHLDFCLVYKLVTSNYHYTMSLIERIMRYIENNSIDNYISSSGRLFINVEVEHLCSKSLLKSLIVLRNMLSHLGVSLVVELTERGSITSLKRGLDSLIYLREQSVLLAIDDLCIVGDFRYFLLERDLVDIIKIEWDLNHHRELDRFLKNNDGIDIVLERVEDFQEVESNVNLKRVWGFQGFYCCRGVPVNI